MLNQLIELDCFVFTPISRRFFSRFRVYNSKTRYAVADYQAGYDGHIIGGIGCAVAPRDAFLLAPDTCPVGHGKARVIRRLEGLSSHREGGIDQKSSRPETVHESRYGFLNLDNRSHTSAVFLIFQTV